MSFIKTILPLVLVWLISFPLYAVQTLTYGPESKVIAGIKITMTESDGTVTILSTDSNGQVTLSTTSNTYTLSASLAETGEDPVDLLDAIWILQHSGELRTLTTEQLKAADVSGDGEVDLLDAIYILQHSGELRTLSPSLVFLDTATNKTLSETTFNPGDTPSITVIRTGDVDQGFDPTLITDHAPILTGKTTLSIAENEAAVSTLIGTDADDDTLTYEITGGDDKELFAINASTGVLSFKAGPDYEDPLDTGGDNLYNIVISVSDGTNDTSQALVVSVADLNEKIAVTNKTINENESGAMVGDLSIIDIAFGNTNITYALSGDDAEYFVLDGTTLKLKSDLSANYESKSSYSLTITATNSAGETITEKVVVKIANVNETPVLVTALTEQSVDEDSALSFTIPSNTFFDVDGNTLTYTATLSNGQTLPPWLSFTALTRTFSGTPMNADVGDITVKVTASDGSLSASGTFTLTVVNTNDAPTLANALIAQSVDEDAAFDFTLPADTFNDVDVGDTLTYTATLGNSQALPSWLSFAAVTRTFSGTPLNGDVGSITVKVWASDGNLTASDTFVLTVANTNDAPTLANALADQNNDEDAAFDFTLPADTFEDVDVDDTFTYTATLSDGSSLPSWLDFAAATQSFSGTPLNGDVGAINVTVTATDTAEAAISDTFTLTVANTNDAPTEVALSATAIDENAAGATVGTLTTTDDDNIHGDTHTYALSGTDPDSFEIVNDQLKLLNSLSANHEVQSSYSLTVTTTDAAETSFNQVLTITVIDTNDSPVITSAVTFSADENQTGVDTVTATDEDGDVLTYTLSGTDEASISINADTGAITFNSAPNYEVKNSYAVTVTVSDGQISASQPITITILDVNDSPVMTSAASFSANENQIGVGTVTASDEDGNTLTYSLSGTDAAYLSVDENTGVITFDTAPDYETQTSYSVTVTVSDGIINESQALIISIININDNTPVITSAASFSANENQTGVGVAMATDADGDDITYELSGTDEASISINSTSGAITFNSAPNYEVKNSYTVTAAANDGLFSASQPINITILDVNDYPVMTSAASFSAAENQTAVNTVTASDEDGHTLTYSLSGTDTSSLSIDNTSGVVTFVSEPDYETKMSYSVNVNINDGINISTASITINITNVNEIHALALSNESIDENDAGAVVGVLSSPDPDIYTNSSYDYEIVGGSDYFFINSSNNLRLKPSTSFNYEDKNSYTLTITSTDDDFVVEKEFIIAVNNANEAPYATGVTSFDGWASLNQFFNLPFVDPEGDSIAFEVIGGTDSSFFLIEDQLLKFSKLPNAGSYDDANGDGIYEVEVKASDQEPLSSSAYFYINVQKNIAASHTFDVDNLDGKSGSFIRSIHRAGPGDINGDGLDDLFMRSGLIYGNTGKLPMVVESSDEVTWGVIKFTNTVTGCYPGSDGDPNWWNGTQVAGTFIANIDGDNKKDALTEKVDWSNPTPQYIKVVMADEICSGWPNNNPSRGGNFQIPDNSQGQRIDSIYDVGDLNGDGLDDFFFDDFTGQSIISLGGTGETFTITYPGYNVKKYLENISGDSVIIGDVNGDGFEDIYINLLIENYSAATAYKTTLIFGREVWGNIDLSTTDASSHIEISFPDATGQTWFSSGGHFPDVTTYGEDLNADGIQDFSISEYVIFGRTTWPPVLDLNTLDGSNGFRVTNPTVDMESWSHDVDFVGDVNADGVEDFIVVAAGGGVARARLFWGKDSYEATFDARVRFDSVTRGVEFEGCTSGRPTIGLAKDKTGNFDFNGDGFEDLLLKATGGFYGCTSGFSNTSFLIYGGDFTGKVNFIGSETNDSFEGSVSDEIFVTGSGNDQIKTNGGLDVVYAGPGDDVIEIKDLNFKYIDAGYGIDTVKATAAFDLDLTSLFNGHKLSRIEKIDTDNGLENIISIGVPNVISLTEDSMSLTIEGDTTDFLELSSDFEKDNSYSGDNDKYTSSKAYIELYVSKDITIL